MLDIFSRVSREQAIAKTEAILAAGCPHMMTQLKVFQEHIDNAYKDLEDQYSRVKLTRDAIFDDDIICENAAWSFFQRGSIVSL
jgi:hypothetical protein